MSAAREELLQAYQRELVYLRRAGAQFAARYPKVAGRLQLSPDAVNDPHVERLIESFAFLTARIQQRLDAELPELTTALLGVLQPHFVEPIPSLSIAQMDVDAERGMALAGHPVPRHTQLFAEAHAGQTVSFRTCYPVTLWPVAITEARIESTRLHPFLDHQRDVSAVLRLRLTTLGKAAFRELELSTLRLFLDGDPGLTFGLHELLTCHALRLAVRPDGGEPRVLPASALTPVGFAPEEDVLPSPAHAPRGHRLLQEYFAFPEKFLFFDLALGRENVRAAEGYLDVFVLLDEVPDRDQGVGPENFRLGCTPIINLFPRTTEPIRIDHRRSEYPLVPDHRREKTTEIHSILKVSASSDSSDPSRGVEPLFSFSHPAGGDQHQAFWHARRLPTGREDMAGTEVLLSFLDLSFSPTQPAEQTVYAHTLCTNRDLAVQLPPGKVLQTEVLAPLRGIRCLRTPTPEREPPLGGPSLWRLISQLSLNHLSLSGPEGLEALRELLRLHGLSAASGVETQLRGLVAMETREVLRHVGRDAWRGFCRGTEVVLTLDESVFVGGGAMVLGSVLSRFLGLYASVGSFVELVLKSEQREGIWKRWPPMAGEQAVL